MTSQWGMYALTFLATTCGVMAQSVSWTDPPDGKTITVNQLDGNDALAPREITVQYTASRTLDAADVTVLSNLTDAPEVDKVSGSGSTWVIHLTRQIAPGEELDIDVDGYWVTIEHRPGDVDNDGDTDSADRTALQNAINASSKSAIYDINGDNAIDADDLTSFDNVQTTHGTHIVWDTFTATGVYCCCDGIDCQIWIDTPCGGSATSTSCPCDSDTCE